jgi:hypothetical protein
LTEPPKQSSEEEEFVAQRLKFFRKRRVELRLPKAIVADGYAEIDKNFHDVLAKLWLIKCDSEDELLVALAKNLKQVACM